MDKVERDIINEFIRRVATHPDRQLASINTMAIPIKSFIGEARRTIELLENYENRNRRED